VLYECVILHVVETSARI